MNLKLMCMLRCCYQGQLVDVASLIIVQNKPCTSLDTQLNLEFHNDTCRFKFRALISYYMFGCGMETTLEYSSHTVEVDVMHALAWQHSMSAAD